MNKLWVFGDSFSATNKKNNLENWRAQYKNWKGYTPLVWGDFLSLKIQQLDVLIETKTLDDVFVRLKVSVQFKVIKLKVYDAFYKLDYPHDQITSYVFDVVRAEVPKMKLDDVFVKKDDIAKTGLGIDFGALQYYYPGSERGRNNGWAKANTTEVYGAINYYWVQAKYSHVVSKDAWGFGRTNTVNADAKGTYYAELNANIPIGELIGGGPLKGLSAVAHYGKQEFDNDSTLGGPSYEDYKLGIQNAFDGGINVGAFYTETKGTRATMWTYNGKNIGEETGTFFVQKTF